MIYNNVPSTRILDAVPRVNPQNVRNKSTRHLMTTTATAAPLGLRRLNTTCEKRKIRKTERKTRTSDVRRVFGFAPWRPITRQTIESVLRRRSASSRSSTGVSTRTLSAKRESVGRVYEHNARQEKKKKKNAPTHCAKSEIWI